MIFTNKKNSFKGFLSLFYPPFWGIFDSFWCKVVHYIGRVINPPLGGCLTPLHATNPKNLIKT